MNNLDCVDGCARIPVARESSRGRKYDVLVGQLRKNDIVSGGSLLALVGRALFGDRHPAGERWFRARRLQTTNRLFSGLCSLNGKYINLVTAGVILEVDIVEGETYDERIRTTRACELVRDIAQRDGGGLLCGSFKVTQAKPVCS